MSEMNLKGSRHLLGETECLGVLSFTVVFARISISGVEDTSFLFVGFLDY